MSDLRYILDLFNVCTVAPSAKDDTHSSSRVDVVGSHQGTGGVIDESGDLDRNVLQEEQYISLWKTWSSILTFGRANLHSLPMTS